MTDTIIQTSAPAIQTETHYTYKGEIYNTTNPFVATASRTDYDLYYVVETAIDTLSATDFLAKSGTYIYWLATEWIELESVFELLTFVGTVSTVGEIEAYGSISRFDSFYVSGTVDITDPITTQTLSHNTIIWWGGPDQAATTRSPGLWTVIENIDLYAATTNYWAKKYLSSLIGRLFGPTLIDTYPGFVEFVQSWLMYCDYTEDGSFWQVTSKLDTLQNGDEVPENLLLFLLEQYAQPFAARSKSIPYLSNYKKYLAASSCDYGNASPVCTGIVDESEYWKDPSKTSEGVEMFPSASTMSAFYIGASEPFYSAYFDLGKTLGVYNRGSDYREMEYSIWNGTTWTEVFPTANSTIRIDRDDSTQPPTSTINHFRNSGLVTWLEEDCDDWDYSLPDEILNDSTFITSTVMATAFENYWLRVRPKTVASTPVSPMIVIGTQISDTWDSYNYTNMRFLLHYARKFAEGRGTVASIFFLFAMFGGQLEVISAAEFILTPSSGRLIDNDITKPVDVASYRADCELPLKWPHIHGCETQWKYDTQNDYAYNNTDYVDYTYYTMILRSNLEIYPYKQLVKDLAIAAGIQICWVYDLGVYEEVGLIDETTQMMSELNLVYLKDQASKILPDPVGTGDPDGQT